MSIAEPKEYQKHTYEEFSLELNHLQYAFKIIRLMYNRLTLVDGYSHRQAFIKIGNDHTDFPGFSRRNIYRYLPSNNPKPAKKVVPSRHKSDNTQIDNNHLDDKTIEGNSQFKNYTEIEFPNSMKLEIKNQELKVLHSSVPVKVDSLMPNMVTYQVPKSKFKELLEAITKSFELMYLQFDYIGNFLSAISDTDRSASIPMGDNQSV